MARVRPKFVKRDTATGHFLNDSAEDVELPGRAGSSAYHRISEYLMGLADAETDRRVVAAALWLAAVAEDRAAEQLLRVHPERARTLAILHGSAEALAVRAGVAALEAEIARLREAIERHTFWDGTENRRRLIEVRHLEAALAGGEAG